MQCSGLAVSIRVHTTLNQSRFFYHNMDVKTSLSVSDHRMSRWRERRCLYSFRQRQIGQSDYDITAYCGRKVNTYVYINAFNYIFSGMYYPL